MDPSIRSFTPAQASVALGVSAKALRVYEQHGLLHPGRTRTGWRTYDAKAMARGAEIVAWRGLGFGLAEVARILNGRPRDLDIGLAAHEARLHQQVQRAAAELARVRSLRADLAQDRTSETLHQTIVRTGPLCVGFALPWPWNGEWFAVDVPRLAFITGPLGSGKTRFARRLAAALPDAVFLGLDRLSDCNKRPAIEASHAKRVDLRLRALVKAGAERSDALEILLSALEAPTPDSLVVDMVEEGLSAATQTALMADLRLRETNKRALILMTRSSKILDLEALDPTEVVILCPANHGVPLRIVPYPGGLGYEAVATCVGLPEVRTRVGRLVASRPEAV